MASIGLTVHRSPFLGLADTLSQAFTGDAELKAKLALTSSEIWKNEYANRLAQAQAAQEAQKTADLQKLAEERASAQPGIVKGYVGAVPAPVDQPAPVEISRIAGPVNGVPVSAPPSIVDMNYYNDQKAAAEARGRLAPYLAKDATDLSSAYFRDVGGSSLASGLTPGGPAAVGRTPDQMRLASTLYTGNAPTTTTMMTSGDTAPALNATREAAGKLPYDIALEQAKAEAKAQADAAANPAGTAGAGPAAVHLAALKAKPPGSLTPEEQQLIPLLQSIVDKELSIALPEKSTLQTFGPDGVKQTAGPPEAPPGSIYTGGTGVDPIERGHLDTISAKIQTDPSYVPTQLEYSDYETAFTNQYLTPKPISGKGANNQEVIHWVYLHKPDNVLTPAQVQARMAGGPPTPAVPRVPAVPPASGVGPAGAGPVLPASAATATPSITPPATGPGSIAGEVVTQDLGPGPEYVGSANQNQDKTLLPVLAAAYKNIRDTPPGDIPNAFWQVWGNPTNDPSTIETWIEQNAPASARRYLQALNQFSLNLYLLSGAAFPGGEKPQNIRTFTMSQADNADPQTRANKLQAMVFLLNGIQNNAFAGDPAGRHKAQADGLKRFGIHFDDSIYPPDPVDPAASQVTAPTAGPNKLILAPGVPVPPNWEHYTPAAAERYRLNHPPTQAQ